jgi:hypothetical protein
MTFNDFSPCDLVKRISDEKIGVVISDDFGCCGPDEVMVVYEGTTFGDGTDFRELENLGPEKPVADPEKCGAGKGPECCIFLAMSRGFTCERFGHLRNTLIFRKESMKAKREPTAMFPKCQLSKKETKQLKQSKNALRQRGASYFFIRLSDY